MPRRTHRESKPSTSRAATQRTQVESSDDDSDTEQNATSRTTEDISHLIMNFVKYFLNYSTTKNPIKRTDLTKALNIPQKDYTNIYTEGVKILKNLYGLEVVEVPESKSGKMYMICSTKPNVTALSMPLEQRREATALFIMLAFIFMKGGNVHEGIKS